MNRYISRMPVSLQSAERFHHAVLPSTSDTARSYLLQADPVSLPFVVSADHQTAGRGRGENRWFSDSGSLSLTVSFNPAEHGIGPDLEPCICLALAASLIRSLEEQGDIKPDQAGIRWPNDLEANGRKFGGLLAERLECSGMTCIVLGIGLNLTTELDLAPPAVRRMATTLAELRPESGSPEQHKQPLETETYRMLVMRSLESALERLARHDQELISDWTKLDLLKDTHVQIQLPQKIISGTGAGIDQLGRLKVATPDGVETLSGGSVLR